MFKRKYGLAFTKAVASGNDFIIIDNKLGELDARNPDYPAMARDLCRRHLAVGADGLLVLEDSRSADFRMRIFNPDGSEVTMCGNGIRVSAFYAARSGWGDKQAIETGAGVIRADITEKAVKIKMSDPKDIKMGIGLGIGSNVMTVHYINTGVPHVVHIVENIENYPVVETGRKIRAHNMFSPEGTNADFVEAAAGEDAAVHIRTYERGVEDETLACGTGVVASAVVLGILGYGEPPFSMRTKSGDVLSVLYKRSGNTVTDVYLEGAAEIVYEGKV